MQNETLEAPPGIPPQRPPSRAAVRVVSPQERERIKKTLQLAEAHHATAEQRPQGEFCSFAQKVPAEDAWGNHFQVVECSEGVGMSLQSAGPDETLGTSDDVRWEGFVSSSDFESNATGNVSHRNSGYMD